MGRARAEGVVRAMLLGGRPMVSAPLCGRPFKGQVRAVPEEEEPAVVARALVYDDDRGVVVHAHGDASDLDGVGRRAGEGKL